MGTSYWSIPFPCRQKTCRKLRKSCFVSTLVFLLSAVVCAGASASDKQGQLIELGTVGPTVSTENYYRNVDISKPSVDPQKIEQLISVARQSISREMFFPIQPVNIQPGIMKGYRFEKPKTLQPFALIGTDALSIRWLQFRHEKLVELKAPIYVVQADSFEVIQSLASEFAPLKFVPSSGDGIAAELNVASYPFLVTSAGVWQ